MIEVALATLALAFVLYAFCALFSIPAYWRWNGISYRDHDFEASHHYWPRRCRRCGGEPEQHPPLYERLKRRLW
jgi:hypothetical protein